MKFTFLYKLKSNLFLYHVNRCVEELKNCENWVLPALKQIREICCLYDSVSGVPLSLPSGTSGPRLPATLSRQAVIERLQSHHSLVILVTNSLTSYMDRVRKAYQGKKKNNFIEISLTGN